MSFSELKTLVQRAIVTFLARDSQLFELKADEWSMAHRLAVYLEQEIAGWDVDCEYNKQARKGNAKTNAMTGHDTQRTRPDIILHHRGKVAKKHNLLIIEIKRSQLADDQKVMEATRRPDGRRKYQYQFGLALVFLPRLDPRWYANGESVF